MNSTDIQSILKGQPNPAAPGPANSTDIQSILKGQSATTGNPGLFSLLNSLLQYKVNWPDLTPVQKQAAITIASIGVPAGLGAQAVKMAGGSGGIGAALAWLAGTATEGGAVGGAVGGLGQAATGGDWKQGALEGAAAGAAGNAILGAIGSQIPRVSAAARKLMDAGIVPTVGQAADQGNLAGRMIRRAEEAMGSAPIVGDVVRNSRARSGQEWQNATLARANPPDAPPLQGTTQEQIAQLQDTLGSRYDAAAMGSDIPVMHQAFSEFGNNALARIHDSSTMLSTGSRNQLQNLLETLFTSNLRPGPGGQPIIPGDALKAIESRLGEIQTSANKAAGIGNNAIENHDFATVVRDIKQGIKDMRTQVSPDAAVAYQQIDPLYGQLRTMEKASTAAPGQAGEFTPAQVLRAQKGGQSQRTFARGGQPDSLQEWSTLGQQVIPNTLPNSGTADRSLLMLTGLGLVGGGYGQTKLPGSSYASYLAAAPSIALGGSRIGQKGLVGLMDIPNNQAGSLLTRYLRGEIPNAYVQSQGQ